MVDLASRTELKWHYQGWISLHFSALSSAGLASFILRLFKGPPASACSFRLSPQGVRLAAVILAPPSRRLKHQWEEGIYLAPTNPWSRGYIMCPSLNQSLWFPPKKGLWLARWGSCVPGLELRGEPHREHTAVRRKHKSGRKPEGRGMVSGVADNNLLCQVEFHSLALSNTAKEINNSPWLKNVFIPSATFYNVQK